MPTPKFEIQSLPQLVERGDRLWFKLRLDDKMKWQPDEWREPLDDGVVQSVLNDSSLKSKVERIHSLMKLSGVDYFACGSAIEKRKWSAQENTYWSISTADFKRQMNDPIRAGTSFWVFRNRLVKVTGVTVVEELPLLIKHKVLSHERAFDKVKREVDAFENFEALERTSREPIPQKKRMFVWQRDKGRCVECGSKERLEYDHIVPLANGGSNTERNIQLLCEGCNRSKGSSV